MTNEEVARQLETYLEELNESLKDCKDRLLLTSEAGKIINDTINKAKKILPENTRQYKIFDRETSELPRWARVTLSGYVDKTDCKIFEQIIMIRQKVLQNYEPEFIQGDQGKIEFHFSEGEVFDAKLRVYETMKKAVENLIIIDPYAGQDTEILKYIKSLRELKKDLQIQVLTEKETSMFRELYNELVKKRGNIEAKKIENILHDRYLIIDKSEIWHLGTSINGIGKGNFTMTKLMNKEGKNKIINDFNTHWANAKSLDDKKAN